MFSGSFDIFAVCIPEVTVSRRNSRFDRFRATLSDPIISPFLHIQLKELENLCNHILMILVDSGEL